MIKDNKVGQIRVRVTQKERASLDRIILERQGKDTLSDVVREALGWLIHPGQDKAPVYLSSALSRRVMEVARELNRDKNVVVEEALCDVLDLVEEVVNRPPLVVQEIRLRRSYRGKKG